MSELIWIAVPGGIGTPDPHQPDRHEATLRVVITPRLDGGTLDSNGMKDWPPRDLVHPRVTVEFARSIGGAVASVTPDPPPQIAAQDGLWKAFFDGAHVTPPQRRAASAALVHVDATTLKAQAIASTFTAVASTDISEHEAPVPVLNAAARRELQRSWSGDPPPQPAVDPPTSTPPFVPPDFNRTIVLLREHPAVLRALGLIFDVKIDASGLPFPTGVVRVTVPQQPAGLPTIKTPWTSYTAQFMPGPSETREIVDGMVTLNAPGTRWSIVTVDVDSGARRLKDAALALVPPPADADADETVLLLPALRSNGFALVKRDRQSDYAHRRRMADARARDGLEAKPLTADDLMLGYRVDVKPLGHDWRSLNWRDATYTVTRNGRKTTIQAPAREEGHLKVHAAVDDGTGELRADEIVARWSGWSLAVPRPDFAAPAVLLEPAIDPRMAYQFRWTFGVPNTPDARDKLLPRLRFSQGYRLRVRVADIAGGGLPSDPHADRNSTDPVTYLRYEPLGSPEVAMPANVDQGRLQPGEAVDRVVIRSDGETPVSAFANNRVRILTAPRASFTLAEQHGAFDSKTPAQTRDLVLAQLARPDAPPAADGVLFPDYAVDGLFVSPRPAPDMVVDVEETDRSWAQLDQKWPDFTPKQIELEERTGDSPILEWKTDDPAIDRLIVRLKKAEEVALDLSSFPHGDRIGDFAVSAPDLHLPAGASQAVKTGRHPLVSPVRTITLVHAVRRPINLPAGAFSVHRRENETFATLDAGPPLLGLDPGSTAKAHITASWTDPIGPPVTDAPVHSQIIRRQDEDLRDNIVHKFGDTRHRMVTYKVTAVSRFRQYFDATEPDRLFSVSRTVGGPVPIPSSARPSPLTVLAVRPAFAWEPPPAGAPAFPLHRKRLAGRLRIELTGDWYETGDEEVLAVVFSKDSFPSAAMEPFLTRVGMDPITIGSHFLPMFPTAPGATGQPGTEVRLKEAPDPVMVVPFQPWRGPTGWLVDVALPELGDPGSNSWPFVELAVARYQPNSLPGLELSKVVKAELAQIMPERRLDVTRSGDVLSVSLQGAAQSQSDPSAPKNTFSVVLERFQAPLGTSAAAVELTALATPAADGLPAWVAVDDQVHLGNVGPHRGMQDPRQEVLITIPPGVQGPLRLRIRESEEDRVAPSAPFNDNGELTARTIYTDIVMLP
jgi:hypothetical protein